MPEEVMPHQSLDDDPRVRWLRDHAVALCPTDPADEDFSDLAPLAEALSECRVLMLGEATHGVGLCLLAI